MCIRDSKRIVQLRIRRQELARFCRSYDIVFHTQTSLWIVPHPHSFSFFYEPGDLWTVRSRHLDLRVWNPRSVYHEILNMLVDNGKDVKRAENIPLSSSLQGFLQQLNYRHVAAVLPPCELDFKPRRKVERVVQVSRISPRKDLEEFFEIARLLPEYEFLIVGYSSPEERALHPGYFEKIAATSIPNVRIVLDRIRNVPQFLEESSVYLYTSKEPGMNISTVQAAAAGCVPVTPSVGGGSEVVRVLERGCTYSSVRDAAVVIKDLMTKRRWTPAEMSEAAQIFAPNRFRETIRSIVRNEFQNSR